MNQQIQQNQQQEPIIEDELFKGLSKHHKIAIELRLLGFPYADIARQMKAMSIITTEQTLRTWFSEGKTCHAAYNALKEKRIKELHESLAEVQDQIKQGAMKAIAYMRKLQDEGTEEEKLAMGKEMLDRGGFPRVNKAEVSGKVESTSMDTIAESLKALAEGRKPQFDGKKDNV